MKINLILPKPHEAQLQMLHERKRFNVQDCGRRFGKTTLDINEAAEVLLEGYPVGCFFPTYKMLAETWRQFVNIFAPVRKSKNESEHRLELVTGGVLEMWSMDAADTARGRKYKRLIVDEAALIPNLMDVFNAVLRPMLVDYKGDAYFKGTPKGRNGFWQMFTLGQDQNNTEWKSWQFPTSANPFIPASEVEAMKNTMPELIYRQEVLAEFIDDQGGVFRRVQEAIKGEAIDEPDTKRQYIAGVDVAASIDYTVVTVMDVESKQLVYLDRFNRVDYNVLEDRLQSLYNRWNLDVMKIEQNSIGQAVIDHMENRGMNIIPFMTTSATKQPLITQLQSAFEHGEIGIYNDPVLIGELLSFESKRSPSGSFTYSAPDGLHDDCVMSLALAWDCIGGNDWSIATSGRY